MLFNPDLATFRRILIVKLSALGDVVHALPVAAALRERYPHLEIEWVAEPMAAPLLEGSPVLSQVHVAPKQRRVGRFWGEPLRQFLALRRCLRERQYDLAIDLQGLTKSAIVALVSGAKMRIGYNWLRELAPFLERRIPRRPESLHIVDQLLDVARYLGAEPSRVQFPLGIGPQDHEAAMTTLRALGLNPSTEFLVMNPTAGGGGGYKGLTPETMAAIITAVTRATSLPWVLVGAPGDRERSEAVAAHAPGSVYNAVGQTSVRQLAAIIRMARVHVSGDSGSAHIASAVATPPVTVYGRSNPARVGPYGYARYVVDARRYCTERCRRYHERAEINKPAVCQSGGAVCMSRVKAEDVVPIVLRALEEGKELS